MTHYKGIIGYILGKSSLLAEMVHLIYIDDIYQDAITIVLTSIQHIIVSLMSYFVHLWSSCFIKRDCDIIGHTSLSCTLISIRLCMKPCELISYYYLIHWQLLNCELFFFLSTSFALHKKLDAWFIYIFRTKRYLKKGQKSITKIYIKGGVKNTLNYF